MSCHVATLQVKRDLLSANSFDALIMKNLLLTSYFNTNPMFHNCLHKELNLNLCALLGIFPLDRDQNQCLLS